MRVLVTGGAGFIGSHTIDALVEKGHTVRVLDNLDPQVHSNGQPPKYLHPDVELIQGDVRDRDALLRALDGIEAVFYLAATVGVGQSMYEISRYVEVNTLGAANFLDILANEKHTVGKMVVASSMSIYGEGAYRCDSCGPAYPKLRSEEQLKGRKWETRCPVCSASLKAVATNEDKPLFPSSIYAVTKRDHEEMFLAVGRSYGIPTVALRYFNVYGPRQALSNPYTGVVAIFSSRVINGKSPVMYEDGVQSRDFVHVYDIAKANVLALEREEANYQIFNVGTGNPTTVWDIAVVLCEMFKLKEKPRVSHRYRAGDVRHCYADIHHIGSRLGYAPQMSLEQGLAETIDWLREQNAEDLTLEAQAALEVRGLVT